MECGETSKHSPSASPPQGGDGGYCERRPRPRGASLPQPDLNLQFQERATLIERFNRALPNIVCEVVEIDLSYLDQARRLYWGFFDE